MRKYAVCTGLALCTWSTLAFAQDTTSAAPAPAAAAPAAVAPAPTAPAEAEPASEEAATGEELEAQFDEPTTEPEYPGSDWKIEAGTETRIRSIRIDPIELSGTDINLIHWTEMRSRLDTKIIKPGVGALTLQLDALDGLLLGDNGQFVGPPPNSNSGVSLSAKKPNLTRWEMGLRGENPLERDDYGPVLAPIEPIEINHLYMDVNLPVGLLRIGRQPLNYGATITSHDGGRHNRWGVSKHSDSVDRILFGTKLDEVVKAVAGSDEPPDLSQDNGVLFAVFHDWMKQDDVALFKDDLRQIGIALQWRKKEADWFGAEWRNFMLSQGAVRLRNTKFDSTAFGFPFTFNAEVGDFGFDAQYMFIKGASNEISEGFAALAFKPSTRQDIIGHGARAVIDYNAGPVRLTLEGDYASGDDDPRSTTPITSFSFARDMNVGLLMFEHILAFESARSVGVGIENLSGADVESFPLTEASTEGRFTNAVAAFPQVRVDWLNPKLDHQIHTQVGVLVAWSAAKGGAVDPIMTSLAEDGEEITDDAVNYHGGTPDRFYGTEIDVQIGYTFKKNFFFVLEGAALLPGPALWDENNDAVNSFLVENRFVLAF